MKTRMILVMAAFILLTACFGCSESEDMQPKTAFVPFEGWQSFTIVRPDTADKETIDAATALRTALEETHGVRLTLTTDWVKRGEEVPTGTAEILVGSTNRAESAMELAYFDYAIAFTGGRVVINGGSSAAVSEAMNWFITNCITAEQVSLPSETYTYAADYPLAGTTIDGVPLSEFSVITNIIDSKEAVAAQKELASWLAEQTGVYHAPCQADESEHDIEVRSDENTPFIYITPVIEKGNIIMKINPSGAQISDAIELFKERVETAGETAITTLGDAHSVAGDNFKVASDADIKKLRAEADARIGKIMNSKNMEIPQGKIVYYVSPDGNDANDGKTPETAWKSLDKVNTAALSNGSFVCFERGGLWRGQVKPKQGVTYTAYGEGDKPAIYASPEDGADASKWTETDTKGVWIYNRKFEQDVGNIVFNHGEFTGFKVLIKNTENGKIDQTLGGEFKDYSSMTTDLQFYHDKEGYLYLCSDGNPGERFDSIEFAVKLNCFTGKVDGVTVDNLTIKYTGAHGVGLTDCKNLTVTNCEFGWIGGSILATRTDAKGLTYDIRYGNAVQIWGSCDGYTVTDCYMYQIYDAGITNQYKISSSTTTKVCNQKNIYYARNVIDYANWSIEYYLDMNDDENASTISNFVIEDNHLWYAGRGFSEQRPNKNAAAHIKSWMHRNRANGFEIKNNVIADTKDYLIHVWSGLLNADGSESMPAFENNTLLAELGGKLGYFGQNDSTLLKYDLKAEENMDGYGKGNTFYFTEPAEK